MRITVGQLRRVIQEEIQRIAEAGFDPKATISIPPFKKMSAPPQDIDSNAIIDSFKKGNKTLATLAANLRVDDIGKITPDLLASAGLEVDPTGVNLRMIGDKKPSPTLVSAQPPIQKSKHAVQMIPAVR